MVSGILAGAGASAGINIIIKAIDNYSREFKKLDKGLKKQQTSFQKLNGFLKSSGIGYAILAGAAVGFGVEAVKASIESERAMQQFDLAVGDAAKTMLTDMKRASNGMISDFELVNNANRALALGISKNQIPKLLEVATARAKVFGRTTTEAFNDISIGIGRQSRLILDNLGIILNMGKVYKDYAESINKTSDALTASEQKYALSLAIIKETEALIILQGFAAKTTSEQLQQLGAATSNLTDDVGRYLMFGIKQFTGINDINKALEDQLIIMFGSRENYNDFNESVREVSDLQRTLTDDLKTTSDAIQSQIDSFLNLRDITFAGETAKGLEVSQQKEVIRQLELRRARGEEVTNLLDKEREKLNILRLENEQFGNEREIQAAQNKINLEEDIQGRIDSGILTQEEIERIQELTGVNIQSFDEFRTLQDEKLKNIDKEIDQYFSIKDSLETVRKKSVELAEVVKIKEKEKIEAWEGEINKVEELSGKIDNIIAKYKEAQEESRKIGGTGLSRLTGFISSLPGMTKGITKVGDAIIRPNGQIIETDPRDTLIATKNGIPGGGQTIIVQIESLQATDAESVAETLESVLKDKINF